MEKEMVGVKTGAACSHDLGQGFSQTRVLKDTHMPSALLSPRLTSPPQECPSAATALEPRNAPLLKHQCVYVCVCMSHPTQRLCQLLRDGGSQGMQRDVDATP